jgi:glutamyl-tRNA reductase
LEQEEQLIQQVIHLYFQQLHQQEVEKEIVVLVEVLEVVQKQEELEDLEHQDKVIQEEMEDQLLNLYLHKIIQQVEEVELLLLVHLDY